MKTLLTHTFLLPTAITMWHDEMCLIPHTYLNLAVLTVYITNRTISALGSTLEYIPLPKTMHVLK